MHHALLFLGFILFSLPASAAEGNVSLLASLSAEEKEYYTGVFNYTMEAVKPHTPYSWKAHTAKGNITAGKKFISKSKSFCRNFTEIYLIGGAQSQNSGIACKRTSGNGWCRLGPNDKAQTCALENPQSDVDKTLKDVGSSGNAIRHWLGF